MAESEDFRRGMTDARRNVTSLDQNIRRLSRSTVAQVASWGALAMAVKSSLDVANRYDNAQRQLAATSKLTGTSLGFLSGTSRKVQDQFKLSGITANALTIELTKLASKAGDVSKASDGLAAFLDIGAARGLNAEQTLQAVRQAILGIDEGTDKLFGKNPSVLYAEFAAKIGATAGKLTDAQKAQAILNAAMEDGGKVRGEYLKWLGTAQGQQFLLSQGIEKTQQALGKALQPALVAILPIVAKLAEWVQKSIIGWREIFATVGIMGPGAFRAFKLAITGHFAEARAEMDKTREKWRATIAEILASESPAAGAASLLDPPGSPAPSGGDSQTDKAAKERQEARSLAGIERFRIVTDNLIEQAQQQNQMALAKLGTEASITDKLRLQLDLVFQIFNLKRDALLFDTSLSGEELRNEQLRLKLARDRQIVALQIAAAAEKEAKAKRDAVKAKPPEIGKPGAGTDVKGLVASSLGAVLGGGGTRNVVGSLGRLAGSLVGGPIGGIVGGFLGGKLGGLFGGKKQQEEPAVKMLSAIERAQRETITTIQAQTDALLKPDNRFLNLPSTFNIPAYAPGIGGSGPGAMSVSYGDVQVSISMPSAPAAQLTPKEWKRLATEAVEDALSGQRRNSSWG
jgi:hypothetical protein